MVNFKKIERMKKKKELTGRLLGLKDIESARDIFSFPAIYAESNIQSVLVPFISYNLSYPIKTTRFRFLYQPIKGHKAFTFQFVGKVAKIPIYFENIPDINIKQWMNKKQLMLRGEFQRAFNAVYNDLDNNPKGLCYNKVRALLISVDKLEDIHQHFSHHIVILTNGAKLNKFEELPISIIELPDLPLSLASSDPRMLLPTKSHI